MDYSACSECKDDYTELSKLNPAAAKSIRFSFDEKDIEEAHADLNLETIDEGLILSEHCDSDEVQDLTSKNRMLIRNLSGSDSYDKLQTEISEGWNPLSPASIECETEAERLLSSRCGSYASSSHRTVDSMTNVTRMTVSSIDLSQSSKSSDSFSSVSSVQTSSSSSSSDDIEDTDYEQQWNLLWKKHYEEEYLKHYSKFMCSRNQEFLQLEKKNNTASKFVCLWVIIHINILCLGQLEQTFETLTMAESSNSYISDTFPDEDMIALGLPTSFGSSKQTVAMEMNAKRNLTSRKRR